MGLRGDEGGPTAPQGCASLVLHGGHSAPVGRAPSEAAGPCDRQQPCPGSWVLRPWERLTAAISRAHSGLVESACSEALRNPLEGAGSPALCVQTPVWLQQAWPPFREGPGF